MMSKLKMVTLFLEKNFKCERTSEKTIRKKSVLPTKFLVFNLKI